MEPDLTPFRTRTVFLSSGGVLGDTVLRRLIESEQFEVAGIVRSRRVLLRDHGFLRGAIACFGRCGVFYTVYIWLITTFAEAFGWITQCGSITRRARLHKIPVLHTRDINSKEGLEFLDGLRPQVLISAHFDQPLRPPLCDGLHYAAVNLHPSLLPSDQGLEPVLHALREGRTALGVTLHRTAEVIDSGNLLAMKQVQHKNGASVLGAMQTLMACGAELLLENISTLTTLGNGTRQTAKASYNTWPNGRQVWQLYRSGHHLIRFQDARLFFK
jgi:folate-dependent phosphoribosylglycinamide formyltransferase PurN